MEKNTSSEEGPVDAAAAHSEAFNHAVDEYFSKLDDAHCLVKSKADYANLVTFLSGPANDKTIKKSKSEYYAMKNYVVMQGTLIAGERAYLISKKVYDKSKDQYSDVDL
jgi:hypothetical protein